MADRAFHLTCGPEPLSLCSGLSLSTDEDDRVRIKSLLLAFGVLAVSTLAQSREYAYSDAHLHYVDFFQESAGMPALLAAMEKIVLNT